MNALNSLILEGDISKKAEMIPNGVAFEVAYTYYKKSRDGELSETKYQFDIEYYGDVAIKSIDRLIEGQGIRLVGRIMQKKWKDEEGKEYSRIILLAEHIEYKRYKPKN